MLFLGLVLVILGLVWLIWGRNFLGLLVVAAGVFILAMDIAKTVRKSMEKKKEKDSLKPVGTAVCRYDSGLPFAGGSCTVTAYAGYITFNVNGKEASLDLRKITDASAADGTFTVAYTKDDAAKTIICAYDASASGAFAGIVQHIRSNIKYEL